MNDPGSFGSLAYQHKEKVRQPFPFLRLFRGLRLLRVPGAESIDQPVKEGI